MNPMKQPGFSKGLSQGKTNGKIPKDIPRAASLTLRTPPVLSPSVAVVVVHCLVTGEALEAVWERSGLESMKKKGIKKCSQLERKKKFQIFQVMLVRACVYKNQLCMFRAFHCQTNKTSFAESFFFFFFLPLGLNLKYILMFSLS